MRVTLFSALLLTATCDSPAPQLSPPPADASAAVPADAALAHDNGGSCGAVDADTTVDADVADLATAADMTCVESLHACGVCCLEACCWLRVCLPLSLCPDGSYNSSLHTIIVPVCCSLLPPG